MQANHDHIADDTSMRHDLGTKPAKLVYVTPSLTLHGSVRELTGSGSGGNGDGGMPML